jgi:hypothetical protein
MEHAVITPSQDASLTLREARERYFRQSGLDEAGYSARWVRLRAGPISFYFPNTAGRVRAVRFHDLHHVLTGYDTSWTGEGEIAAFELASGCGRHLAAWVLNLGALGIGMFLAPRRMWRAWCRGAASANLYGERFDDALLRQPVAAVRRRLRLRE